MGRKRRRRSTLFRSSWLPWKRSQWVELSSDSITSLLAMTANLYLWLRLTQILLSEPLLLRVAGTRLAYHCLSLTVYVWSSVCFWLAWQHVFCLHVKERENDATKEQIPKTEAPRAEKESQKAGKGTCLKKIDLTKAFMLQVSIQVENWKMASVLWLLI